MLTSLTLRSHGTDTVLSGTVSLVSGTRTHFETPDNKTAILSADLSEGGNAGPYWDWFQALKARDTSNYPGIPYLCSMSGVQANSRGVLWLLGGRLFQVLRSVEANSLEIASRGAKDLTDEDFSTIRDCYRILRSWMDAFKDNMLSKDSLWTAAPLYPSRPTPEEGLPKPLALFQQYKALVYTWNALLASTASALQYMVHPADPSGFIVSINTQLLNCVLSGEGRLTYKLEIEIFSIQNADLLYWVRQTVAESTPEGMACEPTITGVKGGSTVTLTIEGVPTGLSATTKYQTQFVFEILPYFDKDAGGEALGDESGYYESRQNNNYEDQGSATWSFTCNVSVDGHPLDPVEKTTRAPFVAAPALE